MAYFLPGVAPRLYDPNEEIPLKTLKLTSHHTQMPYDFYYLKFCRPGTILRVSESLGELLNGDIIQNTPYSIKKSEQKKCQTVCRTSLNKEDTQKFAYMIDNDYRVQWLLDNLAAVETFENGQKRYKKGFQIGYKFHDKYYLNNHVDITIRYHPKKSSKEEKFTIVGFEVKPESHSNDKNCTFDQNKKFSFEHNKPTNITFTYSVHFEKSETEWSARWEPYAQIPNQNIHLFSFINSIIPVITLMVVVAYILMRTLKKDFFAYNVLAEDPESRLEEKGWKLVHGDVFRPPKHSTALSIAIGSGFQIGAMLLLMIFLLVTKVVTPIKRGSIVNAFLFLFLLMTYFSGLFSSMMNKMFGKSNYKLIAFYSSLLYPGINFSVFLILEFILWSQGSSGAVSFFVLFKLFFLWICISVPLSIYGAYRGNLATKIKTVTKVNLIPRQIPKNANKISRTVKILCAGILPFLAAFVEIYYLMNSIWLDRFYFMVGGFILIFSILTIISCEITIILCYLQLCKEDYNWWWNAFLSSGSSGICLFFYGIYYGIFNLHISHFAPFVLYIGYMSLISFTLFLLTGTIGVVAAFLFISKIYSSIKID
ncbi:hypothetical protein MHBO_000173 [Bonamia ostreae]|uniref:Transmembrane 9 superfamily member n=1 Tax=Bonamia ostreae TaxID=126728 RepID=A0ABV2AEQ3_9EUKA